MPRNQGSLRLAYWKACWMANRAMDLIVLKDQPRSMGHKEGTERQGGRAG